MDCINVAEKLRYDPDLEAQDLDRALVGGKVFQAHFASSEEFFGKNSKFYTDVIPLEYSSTIAKYFFYIFQSQIGIFTNTYVDVLHTEKGLLHMDVGCGSCAITFEIDTNSNRGIVKHREAYKESLTVSTWKEYEYKDIFLLGKAVFDSYFWGDGC